MRGLKQKHWAGVYVAATVLIFAQVLWWATIFTRSTDRIAELQLQQGADEVSVKHEAYHRKAMFFSESLFFAVLTSFGLFTLFRALRAERRSAEIQRNFIETVSHESKTPITALKLRLESVKEKFYTPEMGKDLDMALEEVRRLAGVVDKTMALHRSERQALRFEPVSLAEVVQSVLARLDPWLRAKGAEPDLKLDTEVLVEGDFASLQNTVQSLVENAVIYNASTEKKVAVEVFRQGRTALVRVQDNGPGIATSERNRVFERFYRGNHRTYVGGTGLGLYLVRVIVEAHQGIVRLVDSETPGACFEISLPRREAV